jgi:hypothetical protein
MQSIAFKVSVRVETGEVDTGRSFGTLAAFIGDGVRGVLGCANAAQTRAPLSQRHLEFSIVRDSAPVTIEDLGRPTEAVWRPELHTCDGDLYEAVSRKVWREGKWVPHARRCPVPEAHLCGVVPVGGGQVTFPHGVERVFYGARPILHYEGSLRTGIYYDGLLCVAHVSADASRAWLTVARWRPDWAVARDIQRYHWAPLCDVYAMIGWRGGIYLADGAHSGGDGGLRLFRVTGEGLQIVAAHPPAPRGGAEAYGMAVMHDSLLVGHYPSGQTLRFDGERLTPLDYGEPVVQLLGVGDHQYAYGEAQTLALYGGRLWVGHYPWGYLLSAGPDLTDWRAEPLFGGQTPTPNSAPYRAAVAAKIASGAARTDEFFEEMWARRIHSAALHDNGLALGLASRRGAAFDAARDGFLDAADFADYGAVRMLRTPNTLLTPLPWPANGMLHIEAVANADTLSLCFDGKEVARTGHDLTARELRSLRVESRGAGVYGATEFALAVSEAEALQPALRRSG